MSRTVENFSLGVAVAVAVVLSACGGGGSSGSSEPSGTSSSTGTSTTTAYGTIQGFGSIVVDGVHYNTEDAVIMVNDTPGTQGELFVGQMVTVRGFSNGDGTGVATAVTFDAEIEGPITGIDRARDRLTVLGQTVIVSGLTVFEGIEFANLAVNDFVEISGSFDANGAVRASSVELVPAVPDTVEVKGTVANLDTANRTFLLNALTVDYSTAVLEPAGRPLANGQFVEVEGTAADQGLIASKVEREERVAAERGENAKVEGFVESVVSDTRFVVAGLTVEHDVDTKFEGGSAADLRGNLAIEVKGVIDANGVLQAEKVEIETEDERELHIRLKAPVQAVDSSARTIKVVGVTVNVNPATIIKDDRDDRRPFGLDDLRVGDFVEIRAFISNGSLIALYVERDDDEDRVVLQALLERVDEAANLLVLEGVSVYVSAEAGFVADDDRNLTAQEFYTLAKPGALVEVEGRFNGRTIAATEVSLESDDDGVDGIGEDKIPDTAG